MNLKELKLIKYLREARTELKKVTWPTKKETTKHTLIVIGISIFTAVFLGILDFMFSELMAVVF
jgi:preprotein translocase subunit SecE